MLDHSNIFKRGVGKSPESMAVMPHNDLAWDAEAGAQSEGKRLGHSMLGQPTGWVQLYSAYVCAMHIRIITYPHMMNRYEIRKIYDNIGIWLPTSQAAKMFFSGNLKIGPVQFMGISASTSQLAHTLCSSQQSGYRGPCVCVSNLYPHSLSLSPCMCVCVCDKWSMYICWLIGCESKKWKCNNDNEPFLPQTHTFHFPRNALCAHELPFPGCEAGASQGTASSAVEIFSVQTASESLIMSNYQNSYQY